MLVESPADYASAAVRFPTAHIASERMVYVDSPEPHRGATTLTPGASGTACCHGTLSMLNNFDGHDARDSLPTN